VAAEDFVFFSSCVSFLQALWAVPQRRAQELAQELLWACGG
jgi:hypothetical protein